MGKNNYRFLEDLGSMDRQMRELERERKRKAARCVHRSEKGNLKIEPLSEHDRDYMEGEVRCKYCKIHWNMNPMTMDELDAGITIVHNAIQQIRSLGETDSEKELKLAVFLGELDYNLDSLNELYNRTLQTFGRGAGSGKKKNKNRGDREDNLGGYSSGTISFIGGAGGGGKNKGNGGRRF